ncbi:MAG TPA: hypothetical protein VNB90_05415 [Cytophagaceae bacterium]|nr:hypothetical protein [Cytophagaceae bacterium]
MRILLVLLSILLAIMIAGVYGALYDQITFSISNEFFTQMRFARLGIVEGDVNTRWEVAKIGFVNTWSVGLVLGSILSLIGLLHADNKKMFYTTLQAFLIALGTGFLLGMIAYFFSAPSENVSEGVNIVDQKAFNKVLSMNNYSYNGAIIGMFIGIGWQVYRTRKKKL